jgi:RNA polymerase sigma factor (sigma-70 family)
VKIKKSAVGTPQTWSVAELGAFYTEHSFELKTHANRILKDPTRADEVVQDAFIKVMLAAPELTSSDHALSYLHRTIENICIDLFRAEGRRPHLVVLDDAQAEVESQWQTSGDHSHQISAAEDAAIIRQALALLSPAERTALVMWEMDGRTTAEIAAELGIKESAVRHTVSRARASLRKVLSTLIIDEERGLTALDLLSTSYKKAAELAHKSSRAALSLILVVAAFLGFHTMTGAEPKVLTPAVSTTTELQIPTTPVRPVVKSKSVPKRSLSNQTNIQDLTNQLDFAKVELSAQVDLLSVIMDTKIFDDEAKSFAPSQITAIKAITSDGGTN